MIAENKGNHDMKYDRAELGIDGNAGFALLGENIQEGECEFVTVEKGKDEPLHIAECRAATAAFNKLKDRLNRPSLSYYIGPSHPRHV